MKQQEKTMVKGKDIKKTPESKLKTLYYTLAGEKKKQQDICEQEMKLLDEIEMDMQKIKSELQYRSSQKSGQLKL